MTLVGDVAQSTTPAGQERWSDVFTHLGSGIGSDGVAGRIADLTIGYRVPEPILDVANRLLPLTGVDATAHRHRLTGIVAPSALHTTIATALTGAGLSAVDHVHELGHDDVPLFDPESVKGLEFDGVVVVNPHEVLDGTPRGARLLYVAMTRAVQELAFVTDADPPALIS